MHDTSRAKFITSALVAATLAAGAGRGSAEDRQRDRHGPSAGQAVPRGSVVRREPSRPIVVSPRVVRVAPYRPYYYHPYRPGFSVGFYAGYPYGYYPFGHSAYGYGPHRHGYGYGYPPPIAYAAGGYGGAYGGVRIEDAAPDAQVFVDGYYVGIVDDFDGAFQHITLPAGPHQIEVRVRGFPPATVDVRVEPGQTITYHAR